MTVSIYTKNSDNYQSVRMEASEARFKDQGYVALPDITISITSDLCRQMIWFNTNENTASQLRKLADKVEAHLATYTKEKGVRDRIAAEMAEVETRIAAELAEGGIQGEVAE